MNEPSRFARNPAVREIFEMGPEERDSAYVSALYDGDSRRAQVIARAPIPEDWPKAMRLLWLDRRGLSAIAVPRDR